MLAPSALVKGLVSRFLPTAFVDDRDSDKPVRLARYGEQVSQVIYGPTRHALVEEGSYILATNPTISTGMVWVAAQTAFSDTTPNFYIFNSETASNPNAKSIYLDYLKLITTAAATTATSFHYAWILDAVPRALGTDNTATITPVNPNGGASLVMTPVIKVQNSATASVITASSSAKRLVARGTLGGLNVAGDELTIVFGSTDVGANAGLTAAQAAAVGHRVTHSPAIIVPPGWSLTGHIWAPGSAASPAPEFEFGMWAR
jgi:hypothetical protein